MIRTCTAGPAGSLGGEHRRKGRSRSRHQKECGRCGLGSAPGERGAFRIIFLEPLFGKLWRREYLEVIDVANFLVRLDCDQDTIGRAERR